MCHTYATWALHHQHQAFLSVCPRDTNTQAGFTYFPSNYKVLSTPLLMSNVVRRLCFWPKYSPALLKYLQTPDVAPAVPVSSVSTKKRLMWCYKKKRWNEVKIIPTCFHIRTSHRQPADTVTVTNQNRKRRVYNLETFLSRWQTQHAGAACFLDMLVCIFYLIIPLRSGANCLSTAAKIHLSWVFSVFYKTSVSALSGCTL